MNRRTLDRHLTRRGSNPSKVAHLLVQSPELLGDVIDGLRSEKATIRFNSSKILLVVAQEAPEALRPHIRSILFLLDSDNKILKSAAIRTLGHLALGDSRGQITQVLAKVLAPISGPDLVVACNAIEGAARIAQAKPKFTDQIVSVLLSVESGRYKTRECRNIAIGKVIDGLDKLYGGPELKPAINGFVRKQRRNSRKTTRFRADRFLGRRTVVQKG